MMNEDPVQRHLVSSQDLTDRFLHGGVPDVNIDVFDFHQMPDGLLGLICTGEQKFRLEERRVQADGLNVGTITWLPLERATPLPPQHAHLGLLLERALPQISDIYQAVESRFDDAGWVSSRLAEILPISLSDKQECLEMDDPLARLERLSPFIRPAEE